MPPRARTLYGGVAIVAGVAVVVFAAPSWLALAAGIAIAVITDGKPPAAVKVLTTVALQLGVVALGAGMNLVVVWHVGISGAAITAVTLSLALALALALGRWLQIGGDTPLLVGVGTAICGGSAIAAVASVVDPEDHELSVSLAVVFVLNAVALVLFPALGHALHLDETVFGRWAALAIHDTSSVVGAGMAYGATALQIATTTKLARALWIVPVTIVIAVVYSRRTAAASSSSSSSGRSPRRTSLLGQLATVHWPWFIAAFVAVAAAFTWIPELASASPIVVDIGRRALVLALFLIGLSLSRSAVTKVGARPLALGVVLWIVVGSVSLALAMWNV